MNHHSLSRHRNYPSKPFFVKIRFLLTTGSPTDFKAHGDQIRVFRHWKSLFNFDKTSKYRFLIEKRGFNFQPIRACSNTEAISVFHTYRFMSANKNKWIYYLLLSIKLPITGFIIYPYQLNYQLLNL